LKTKTARKNLQIERVMDMKINEGKKRSRHRRRFSWFTVRAAKARGDAAKSSPSKSIRIHQTHQRTRQKREFYDIQTVLGTDDDRSWQPIRLTRFNLKTYHEIGKPITVLRNLKKALKKDALVGIIDKKRQRRRPRH
jgi:hypothetical protein